MIVRARYSGLNDGVKSYRIPYVRLGIVHTDVYLISFKNIEGEYTCILYKKVFYSRIRYSMATTSYIIINNIETCSYKQRNGVKR